MLFQLLFFLLFIFGSSVQECFTDCQMAEDGLDLQGHSVSADCRCWQECAPSAYSKEAKRVIEEYDKVDPPTLKKVLYVRRDCKDAVLATGNHATPDLLLAELWAVKGHMWNKTRELFAKKSVSSSKDWIMLKVNYHCPFMNQSPYIRRQLRLYRTRAFPGRALFFHKDCERIRYVSGLETADKAIQAVRDSIVQSNESLDEWFLYDSSKEGTCSPLTHRHRYEIRSLSPAAQALLKEAILETYRRGTFLIHSPYHAQMRMYNYAHGTPGFAIWHRAGILNIEEQFRGLGPKFQCLTLPYWDWSLDYAHIKNSSLFSKDLFGSIDATLALGKNKNCGKHNDGCCVVDGWFANWRDHNGKCLSRNYKDIIEIGIPDPVVVTDLITRYDDFGYSEYGKSIATFGVVSTVLDSCLLQCGDEADAKGTCTSICHKLISTKKFRGFSGDLELTHSRVHFSIGGHMYSAYSPSDPLFMINHANVDKVWALWMECQGYLETEDYWPTKQEHFANAYGVIGPYGLSDRLPGWQFNDRETGQARDVIYTTFSYDEDPWEKESKLKDPRVCPKYAKVVAYFDAREKLYKDRLAQHLKEKSQLFFQATRPGGAPPPNKQAAGAGTGKDFIQLREKLTSRAKKNN